MLKIDTNKIPVLSATEDKVYWVEIKEFSLLNNYVTYEIAHGYFLRAIPQESNKPQVAYIAPLFIGAAPRIMPVVDLFATEEEARAAMPQSGKLHK